MVRRNNLPRHMDKVDKLKLKTLQYFWDRKTGGFPEWDWLQEELQVTEEELKTVFKYLGFKED